MSEQRGETIAVSSLFETFLGATRTTEIAQSVGIIITASFLLQIACYPSFPDPYGIVKSSHYSVLPSRPLVVSLLVTVEEHNRVPLSLDMAASVPVKLFDGFISKLIDKSLLSCRSAYSCRSQLLQLFHWHLMCNSYLFKNISSLDFCALRSEFLFSG